MVSTKSCVLCLNFLLVTGSYFLKPTRCSSPKIYFTLGLETEWEQRLLTRMCDCHVGITSSSLMTFTTGGNFNSVWFMLTQNRPNTKNRNAHYV